MSTRRRFIETALALFALARSAWAQAASASMPVRFAALTRSVRIPLDAVATPWHPVPFVAEGRDRAVGVGASERRVLISGVLFRHGTNVTALCVTCPHEQCQVDLVTDEARLARMAGGTPTHPLFECGCHFSVFDAANEGARLSGESPRGLYRFRVAGINDGIVDITHIEAAALSEV